MRLPLICFLGPAILMLAQYDQKFNGIIAASLPIYSESFTTRLQLFHDTAATVSRNPTNKQMLLQQTNKHDENNTTLALDGTR